MLKRLAIILTHPIQYYAPVFMLLAKNKRIEIKVFYTWSQTEKEEKYDPGFKRNITWDIPLLDGYDCEFVENISKDPGSHHYRGIKNPTLNRKIEQWKADAVLVFGWNFISHLQCLRYFKGKLPVFFRGDSTLLDEAPGISLKKILRSALLTWIYKHINYAFYVGWANKAYYLRFGLTEKQLLYAPHVIDNNRFYNIPPQQEDELKEWRSSLHLNDCFVILFAGKLEAKKNPASLLEIAKRLPEKKWRFVVVGNGPLENEIKQAAHADSRFIFLDFQNQQQMPLVYRLANVFILPSVGPGETWGLALNEAMACGLPVIATTKVGGAWDLIDANRNGLMVEPNNIQGMADFIKWLAENPAEYKKMCSYSLNKIAAFEVDKLAEAIENKVLSLVC